MPRPPNRFPSSASRYEEGEPDRRPARAARVPLCVCVCVSAFIQDRPTAPHHPPRAARARDHFFPLLSASTARACLCHPTLPPPNSCLSASRARGHQRAPRRATWCTPSPSTSCFSALCAGAVSLLLPCLPSRHRSTATRVRGVRRGPFESSVLRAWLPALLRCIPPPLPPPTPALPYVPQLV